MQALITQASESKGTAKPPQVIFKALKKKTGVKSLSFEYKRKDGIDANTQFDIDLVSHPMRVDCKAGMLMMDSMDGSDEAAAEDIAKFVKEQQTAKGKFPGPLPVVWRKNMQTVEDVALAKAIGCSGVTLVADQLDDQQMAQLVQACHALKMEVLAEVTDKEQIERALAAGAQCPPQRRPLRFQPLWFQPLLRCHSQSFQRNPQHWPAGWPIEATTGRPR